MNNIIKSLSLEHQWFIFALAKHDAMMEDTSAELVADLGERAKDFEFFAQAAFELYTASFSREDQQAALLKFQDLVEWASGKAATGEKPNFKELESDDDLPTRDVIAKALSELHAK